MQLVTSYAMPNRGNIVHITSSTYSSTILALHVSVTEKKISESLDMSFCIEVPSHTWKTSIKIDLSVRPCLTTTGELLHTRVTRVLMHLFIRNF